MTTPIEAAMMEVMVSAHLAGHELGPLEPVTDGRGGYQASCQRCRHLVWIEEERGLILSFLEEACVPLSR